MLYENQRSNIEKYIYHQADENLNFPLHFHYSFEFICVIEGEIEVIISDKVYTMKKNQAILLFPNQPHSYRTFASSKSYLCVFSKDFIWAFSEKYADYRPVSPIFELDDAEAFSNRLKCASDVYLQKSLFYYLAARIIAETTLIPQEKKSESFVHSTLQYIQANLMNDISLSSLSQYLGYGYNYTSTFFNKSFNTKFPELLNEYRVANAIDLLKNTDMSVTDISIRCGYNSIRSFNRNFAAITKLTPSAFRNDYLDAKKANSRQQTSQK